MCAGVGEVCVGKFGLFVCGLGFVKVSLLEAARRRRPAYFGSDLCVRLVLACWLTSNSHLVRTSDRLVLAAGAEPRPDAPKVAVCESLGSFQARRNSRECGKNACKSIHYIGPCVFLSCPEF